MGVHPISWLLFASITGWIVWEIWRTRTMNKTLRRVPRQFGGYEYVWNDPFGNELRARTNPKMHRTNGSVGDGSTGDMGGDGGCGGGD